ncbi:MAG: aminotransferase class IV [Kocuria sp.]|nr:aminotransferase class IV [Kocuria sp.]
MTFAWDGTKLSPAPEPAGKMRVADSWRQVDGRVRRLDLHQLRFAQAVAACESGLDGGAMVSAAAALVPKSGEWFPRARLVERTLYLDLRRGPKRRPSVVVQVLPTGDHRSNPWVKGPDLAATAELITSAHAVGADEVLLRNGCGHVLEAGHAAVVWWDSNALCFPSAELPVLPSVTRALVEARARVMGIEVRRVSASLLDLNGREVWLLNAFQGIRLVTGWINADITPGAGERFHTWRAALDDALEPV